MLARLFVAVLLIFTAITTYTQTHQAISPILEDKTHHRMMSNGDIATNLHRHIRISMQHGSILNITILTHLNGSIVGTNHGVG